MNQDMSILSLVLHASVVVQLVMAGLLITSLASWTVIFSKLFGLRKVRGENEVFERDFWAGKNLNDLYQSVGNRADAAPLERITRELKAQFDPAGIFHDVRAEVGCLRGLPPVVEQSIRTGPGA